MAAQSTYANFLINFQNWTFKTALPSIGNWSNWESLSICFSFLFLFEFLKPNWALTKYVLKFTFNYWKKNWCWIFQRHYCTALDCLKAKFLKRSILPQEIAFESPFIHSWWKSIVLAWKLQMWHKLLLFLPSVTST